MSALLVLDASAAAVSVGIADSASDALLAADTRVMQRGQVEALLPMIADVRQRAGVAFTDLAAVAATVGPGSFTGIRLGLAAARGIGLAARRPVFGIGSFDAALAALRRARPDLSGTVLMLLDSKRQDVFARVFPAAGGDAGPARVLSPAAVRALAETLLASGPVSVAGDAADLSALDGLPLQRCPGGPPPIAAVADVARMLWRAAEAGQADLPPASPLYLRPPDAAIPQGGGVLPHLRVRNGG